MKQQADKRRDALKEAFSTINMDLPNRSEKVKKWIYLYDDESNSLTDEIQEIVNTIAQDYFIRRYCNYKEAIKMLRLRLRGVRIPREQWSSQVARLALDISCLRDYPTVWPWKEQGIWLSSNEINKWINLN